MTDCNCKSSSEIACKISVFNPEERSRYDTIRKDLTKNLSFVKTTSGYTFNFPNQPSLLIKIVEWISFENRCCPFISFSLHVSGESEKIKVELKGNDAVQHLLKEEFHLD
ncbi:hypothetical protein [Peribacillus sp. FSL M8-0224]|uniref:hypothetical protein n=1 Tax=Peribacillus sp. FSL M8-0224 TaxID=2921568 RepID=UPI0030FB8865